MTFRPPGLFRYGIRSNHNSDRGPPSVAYGPQLGVRLGLSHMQQNLVGLGGNGVYIPFPFPQSPLIRPADPPIKFFCIFSTAAGTYGSGPLHGKLVDARGPRLSLIIAFFTLSIGYLGTRMIFNAGLQQDQERASTTTIALLVICGLLTGNGGSGGLASSLNAVAKSFPEHVVSARAIKSALHLYRLLDCYV